MPEWLPVREAAGQLGMSPDALRRALERRAERGADGTVEANIDGVRGRKFNRLWRVQLGPAWQA